MDVYVYAWCVVYLEKRRGSMYIMVMMMEMDD